MDAKGIRRRLRELSTSEALAATRKFVPSAQPAFGVRVPLLNELAKENSSEGFGLVDELWQAGSFEERLLAVKIVGRLARKNPGEAWDRIHRFVPELSDWAVCDALGMEGIRGAVPKDRERVLAEALAFLAGDGEWSKRFGLVLLTHFVKDPAYRPRLIDALERVSGDRRKYVRSAAAWLGRDLTKHA